MGILQRLQNSKNDLQTHSRSLLRMLAVMQFLVHALQIGLYHSVSCRIVNNIEIEIVEVQLNHNGNCRSKLLTPPLKWLTK